MKEVIFSELSLFQVLVSSPSKYVILAIIALAIIALKCSTNYCKTNKTLSSSKLKRIKGKKCERLADDLTTLNKNEVREEGEAPKKKIKENDSYEKSSQETHS